MGKYHDRIQLEERASASARLYHCLRVGRAYGCHPVLDRLRQPFLNKGNSDGPCYGLFQWPEVG